MKFLLLYSIDIGLVFVLIYMVLVIIGECCVLWMVRGFIVLMLVLVLSYLVDLKLLSFVF